MHLDSRTVLIASLLVACIACGNDNPPPPPPPPPGVVPPVVPPQPVLPGQPGQPPGGMQSNFGTVTLTPGFVPDPHTVSGTSGGSTDSSTWNTSCRGWVSPTPDHILMSSGNFPNLRLLVNGGAQDLTIVVQKPDGTYLCNDDAEGRNPIVQSPFPAGQYKIWIGSYTAGVNAPYNLGFSELMSSTCAALGDPGGGTAPVVPTAGGTSNFGTVTLTPGFVPDPHVATGNAGGPLDATSWNATCRGFVTQTPDHLFQSSGNFSFLKIMVSSTEDTTLVVQKPDGSYVCNDDTEGLNPVVTGAFPPGTYRIWIGSYQAGQNPAYRLGFSELASTSTSQL